MSREIEIKNAHSHADLVKLARSMGIPAKAGWRKPKLAKAIAQAETKKTAMPSPDEPERKPEFEKLASPQPDPETEQQEDKPDGRGGFREGAGRTPGMTDEKARVNRVLKNEVPDRTVAFLVDLMFSSWERIAQLPGYVAPIESLPDSITLAKDESDLLVVPVTNLLNYYFPNVHVSPVLEAWIGLAIAAKIIVGGRIALIRQHRKPAEPEPETDPAVAPKPPAEQMEVSQS